MKNNLLLFATFVLVSLGALASTNTLKMNRYYNDYGNSFTFVESGVTFAVFQNGEFDFYMNRNNGLNVGYQSNNVNISFNSGYNYEAYVQYDDYGAIVQVENIPIYYDYYGRVDRIGNVNINYNQGRLIRVGGLHIHYNNHGHYSHYSGYINSYNPYYVYHPYHNFFIRPLFDFRIVSYHPYRNHYKPVRYAYYKDHSRNKFYNNNNRHYKYGKRDGRSVRQRVATAKVPKRTVDRVARVDRNSVRDNATARNYKKLRKNAVQSPARRTTASTRTNGNARVTDGRTKNATTRSQNSVTQNNRAATERNPVRVQQKRTSATSRQAVKAKNNTVNNNRSITERKPVRVQQKRSSAAIRKPVATQNRSKTVNARKPVKTQARKSTARTVTKKPVRKASTKTAYNSRRKG